MTNIAQKRKFLTDTIKHLWRNDPDLKTHPHFLTLNTPDASPEAYEEALNFFSGLVDAAAPNAIERSETPPALPDHVQAAREKFQKMGDYAQDLTIYTDEINAAHAAIDQLRTLGPATTKAPDSPWAEKIEEGRNSDAISLSL